MSQAQYSEGDIIRHGQGCTALMRVDKIRLNHGGPGHHRYYGKHCVGGLYACYERQASMPSLDDLKMWNEKNKN